MRHVPPSPKGPIFVLFNSSVMYYEDIVGVGIDMYLGSEYPYYNQVVYDV